jgi:hypothetical protein
MRGGTPNYGRSCFRSENMTQPPPRIDGGTIEPRHLISENIWLPKASDFRKQQKGMIMFRGMKSFTRMTGIPAAARFVAVFLFLALSIFCFAQTPEPAQAEAQVHRLILKDGSYQSVTKYEIQGDRVRYYSAERGEWEEVPNALIDWDATKKFEQGSVEGAPNAEEVALDKEIEAETKAAQARTPQVAPGLHLPDEGGVFVLDTYENQPQLAELQQAGGDLDQSAKKNILRSVFNPLGGAKQAIELPRPHAKVQAHTTVPSVYVNIDESGGVPAVAQVPGDPPPLPPSERYKIIRVDVKGNKRTAGAIKIAVTGKTKTDERFVATTVTAMTGGWVKLAPTEPLSTGEYAVAEMLGKDSMNLYVWDFGVNPAAPANPFARNPEPVNTQPKSDQEPQLQKRDKQSPPSNFTGKPF